MEMKYYLITGASSGIGAATAVKLADPNTTLFIHYNNSLKNAEQISSEVSKKGSNPILVRADLSKEHGPRSIIDQISKFTNVLDVVINNAGNIVERRAVIDIDLPHIYEIFTLNAFSIFILSSLSIPFLLASKYSPCIINITSVAIRTGAPGATIYGASKGAVDVFTRGLAKELGTKGVRVNAIAPGLIETPLHERMSTPAQLLSWKMGTPIGRNGIAADVADVVRLLIDNTFITGETIDVNGGFFMR